MSVKILSDAELKGDTKLNQHHATPVECRCRGHRLLRTGRLVTLRWGRIGMYMKVIREKNGSLSEGAVTCLVRRCC
jgi:hypothetical protein